MLGIGFVTIRVCVLVVLGVLGPLLHSNSAAQVSVPLESDFSIPERDYDEDAVKVDQRTMVLSIETPDPEGLDMELQRSETQRATNLTERNVVARVKISMSPNQMLSLDALRKNQIVRHWDGLLAQGYTEVEECFFVLVKQPCRMILRDEETGDEVRLRQKNDGNMSSEKYVPTGVGQEVVRINK